MARDTEDLPVDQSIVEGDTEVFTEDLQVAGDLIMIAGQLDPTEIDLTTGRPRWTDRQREIIVRAKDKVSEWDE